MGKRWNSLDDQFLIDNYKILKYIECAKRLNRSPYSVIKRCSYLGISILLWDDQDINVLKECYPNKGGIWCSNILKEVASTSNIIQE